MNTFETISYAYFSLSERGNYFSRGNVWDIKDNGEGKMIMCKAKNWINRMVELIDEFENEREENNRQISQIDLDQQDVLHAIEFTKFNACEGYYYAKRIKEIREQRRGIKAYQSKYHTIYNLLKNTNLKSELIKVRDVIVLDNYNKKFNNYTPRTRTDLKLVAGQK